MEAEEKVEKAVKDARREERDAMKQLNMAEEGRAHAEEEERKAEMHDDQTSS